MQVEAAPEDHHSHHASGAQRQPARIGTQISGLDASCRLAEILSDPGGELARAIDWECVDKAIKDAVWKCAQAGDEDEVVQLVHIELVGNKAVNRGETLRNGRGGPRFAVVEEVGDKEAQ